MPRLLVALAALLVGGCTAVTGALDRKVDYKSGPAAEQLPPLEVPPELTAPRRDNRYAVPEPGGSSATYSGYEAQRREHVRPGSTAAVLPTYERMRMESAGTQRWLVVQAPAEEVWPLVKSFWEENGFQIALETPEAGVLETGWAENRAKIPLDPVRRVLGRVLDQVYSSGELDRFRTRLERTPDGQGTEIYVSHRGLQEVLTSTRDLGTTDVGPTVWQPRESDPGLEAEFLRRLMVKLGADETKAKEIAAGAPPARRADIRKGLDGNELLQVYEPFDRAWRRVGLALDRVGFTVEDRDRQKGLYFVRYADPEAAKDERGFLARIFSVGSPTVKPERYQVRVSQEGSSTQVNVLGKEGAAERSKTASRILSLLHEQLK